MQAARHPFYPTSESEIQNGPVGLQPAQSLLQEEPGPHDVSVGQMLETYRHLDQPLEGLTLPPFGPHPGGFEDLVGLEVAAGVEEQGGPDHRVGDLLRRKMLGAGQNLLICSSSLTDGASVGLSPWGKPHRPVPPPVEEIEREKLLRGLPPTEASERRQNPFGIGVIEGREDQIVETISNRERECHGQRSRSHRPQ